MTVRRKTGGRSKGTPNKATAEIRSVARKHGPKMITELVRLATNSESDQARVSAIKEVLDRAYGKAGQPLTGEGGEGPVSMSINHLLGQIDGGTRGLPKGS